MAPCSNGGIGHVLCVAQQLTPGMRGRLGDVDAVMLTVELGEGRLENPAQRSSKQHTSCPAAACSCASRTRRPRPKNASRSTACAVSVCARAHTPPQASRPSSLRRRAQRPISRRPRQVRRQQPRGQTQNAYLREHGSSTACPRASQGRPRQGPCLSAGETEAPSCCLSEKPSLLRRARNDRQVAASKRDRSVQQAVGQEQGTGAGGCPGDGGGGRAAQGRGGVLDYGDDAAAPPPAGAGGGGDPVGPVSVHLPTLR